MLKSSKRKPSCFECSGFSGDLVTCSKCNTSYHPSCLHYPAKLAGVVMRAETWHCPDCKTCQSCNKNTGDQHLLICDRCDQGLHTFCANPPLTEIPKGAFICDTCRCDYQLRSHGKADGDEQADSKQRKRKENHDQPSAESPRSQSPTEPRSIEQIAFGDSLINTLYNSSYPEEFHQPILYICETCLSYFKSEMSLHRHVSRCTVSHPPGQEIYRKSDISVWEIDGTQEPVYCRNLCMLAKLFLEHKTLYADVDVFMFYVLTEWTTSGATLLGYFSKEKDSMHNYNLSCILTLPQYQQMGYGKMLIDFSYALSRKEGKQKFGSPEKPLSDLGLVTYRSYWRDTLLKCLAEHNSSNISIFDLSDKTGIIPADIVSTLQAEGLIKYWRGKHVITFNKEKDAPDKKKLERMSRYTIDMKQLKWTPPPPPPAPPVQFQS